MEEDNQTSKPNQAPASDFGSQPALKMRGRFPSPDSEGLDLASEVTHDDAAIDQVARRFRSGPQARSIATEQPPQPSRRDLSEDELADVLLEALDDEESPAPAPELPAELVEDTQKLDPDPAAKTAGDICPSCNAENPPGMRYCVQCGGSMEASLVGRPQRLAPSTPRRDPPPSTSAADQPNPYDVHLVSINEDGSDGQAISVDFLETTLGRNASTRFPSDAFLSPQHARLSIEQGQLFVEDLYSLNGTFLKVRSEVRLTPGDTFLMGRQVLRFERFDQSITPRTTSTDGTRYMGSPAPGGDFKIIQVGIGNVVQNVYCLPNAGAVLGREKGDIIFPHDKFMSSRHAQIFAGDDGYRYLADLNSSNGTWTKIWEKTRLETGDHIFMGQQLFRVHIG